MNETRWSEIKAIAARTLEHAPSERVAFLDDACANDQALRREVESLLAHEDESFLESSAGAADETSNVSSNRFDSGTRLGPYEILSPLGVGGMGEVYRARHVKLRRAAAIKVLPRDFASDPERLSRFEREARAASALNHPTIVTIYDIGEDEEKSTPFIAMELVEGQTLRELIEDAPLPTKTLLALSTQMAEGLAKAHEAGIVHRDLKPENVMVTPDGLVKILDFGLAKLMPESNDADSNVDTVTKATREGTVMGTVQYMSPEQAAGRPLDYRTDQFSFGSILYEMATARRAFRKETAPETLAAIIEGRPEPARTLNPELPEPMFTILERCLAKDPADRYESTVELASELKSIPESAPSQRLRRRLFWSAAALLFLSFGVIAGWNWERLRESLEPGAAPIQSIAVLPFTNTSGDPEQEFFADGMTEVLITDLAKIGTLKVISRTSAMRYKATDKAPSEIARELDVQAIVEGSALRSGDRIRIAAQLIDVNTDELLWAESYERDFQDLLGLQGELARAVVDEIQIALSPEDSARLARGRDVNPEAYETYLKGQFHMNKFTPPDIDLALSYFEMARDIDPDFALAHVGIARVWRTRNQIGLTPTREALPQWQSALQRAQELDDTLAEVQSALASLRTWGEWDWAAADEAFVRAIELDPNDAETRRGYSHFLHVMLRPDEATAQIERALELDPFNNLTLAFYGVHLLLTRRYEEAVELFRRSLEASPANPISLNNLAAALHHLGRHEEALETLEAYAASTRDQESLEALRRGFEKSGYSGAMRSLADTQAARAQRTRTKFANVARLYLRAGENEIALEWLERAYDQRDPNMPYLGAAADLDPLRDEPRFQDLLGRMNLPSQRQ